MIIKGYQRLPDKLINLAWHHSGSVICLVRSLVLAVSAPDRMNNQEGTLLVRKTDPELTQICVTNQQDLLLTGARLTQAATRCSSGTSTPRRRWRSWT